MIALSTSFHNARTVSWRGLGWVALLWLLTASHGAQAADPFFFIQLTDSQFGMCASDANFQQETANFEFAIATANRLRPAFVIVTGDLINKTGDPAQTAEYQRIVAKLDPVIPLYSLAGNHDVGNEPTPETIAAYRTEFGPDHFAFRSGPLLGIVLNSTLIRTADGAPQEADALQKWLQPELEKRRGSDEIRHVIVFQHHPWFVERVDEPDAYNNLPLQKRTAWLSLFRQAGVTHVFAGHTHANSVAQFESLEMVVSCAIGKPMQKVGSGLRIVIVRDSGIEHRFFHLGEIPNQIDLAVAPAQDG